MANVLYPKYKEACLNGTAPNLSSDTIKAVLVDTGTYTYSAAHQYLSSLTGTVGTAITLGTKTVTNGVFDAADGTFTSVSGNTAEALVLYKDTGVAGTSQLIAYIDTATGLALTPNGNNVDVTWNASGIFAL